MKQLELGSFWNLELEDCLVSWVEHVCGKIPIEGVFLVPIIVIVQGYNNNSVSSNFKVVFYICKIFNISKLKKCYQNQRGFFVFFTSTITKYSENEIS